MRKIHALLREGAVYFRCGDCGAEVAVPSEAWQQEHHGDALVRLVCETSDRHQCAAEPQPRPALRLLR